MSKVHYHFDHVGSYLRPQALKEARENLPMVRFRKRNC